MQLNIDFDGDKPEWYWRYLDWGAPEFLLHKVMTRDSSVLVRYKVKRHDKCENYHIIKSMGSLCGTVFGSNVKTLDVSLPRLTLKEQTQLNVTQST